MSYNILNEDETLQQIAGQAFVDPALSATSKNPVQNKVVTEKINELNSNLTTKVNSSDLAPTDWDYDNRNLNFHNCHYVGGGMLKIGNLVFIQIRIQADTSITGDTKLISGLPTCFSAINSMSLSCYTNTKQTKPAYVNSSDACIYISDSITNGTSYIFNGWYLAK